MDDVRRATPSDAAVLGQMLADFNREFEAEGQDAALFAARLAVLLGRDDLIALIVGPSNHPSADLVADPPVDPVGFALVTFRPTPYSDGPLVQLEELYVAPAHRSQGAGSALLAALRAEARRRNALEVLINVDEPDTDARRFYERHGFTCLDPDSGSAMLCYLGAVDPG